MSNLFYPSLPGLTFGNAKQPMWSTVVQRAASGRELRASYYSSPLVTYTLPYDFLRQRAGQRELETLIGFINQMQGSFDSFLYEDPDDRRAWNQPFAIGDGVTRRFQLQRTYGGATQPVSDPDAAIFRGEPTMWAPDGMTGMWSAGAGALMWLPIGTPAWTLLADGIVEYVTAPANGLQLYWSGLYYYRCRFLKDGSEFKQMWQRHWSLSSLQVLGSLSGKI